MLTVAAPANIKPTTQKAHREGNRSEQHILVNEGLDQLPPLLLGLPHPRRPLLLHTRAAPRHADRPSSSPATRCPPGRSGMRAAAAAPPEDGRLRGDPRNAPGGGLHPPFHESPLPPPPEAHTTRRTAKVQKAKPNCSKIAIQKTSRWTPAGDETKQRNFYLRRPRSNAPNQPNGARRRRDGGEMRK